MGILSNVLLLICAAVLTISGCKKNDDSAPTTAPVADEEPEAKVARGYIIQRENEDGDLQIVQANDLKHFQHIYFTDKFWANSVPNGVLIEAEVTCSDLNEKENKLTKVTKRPFTKPIAIFEFLPHELLFRPQDFTSNSIHCNFSISTNDGNGNLNILKVPLNGRLFDTTGESGLKIQRDGKVLPFAHGQGLHSVPRNDFSEYVLRSDFHTDSIRLVCETFSTEEKISKSGVIDFSWFSFENIMVHGSPFEHKGPKFSLDSVPSQTCRIIGFDEEWEIIGYTQYFTLEQPLQKPIINSGGNDSYFQDVNGEMLEFELGYVEFKNNNKLETYIELDFEGAPKAFAQFIPQAGQYPQLDNQLAPVIYSLQLKDDKLIHLENARVLDAENHRYEIQPGGKLRIQYVTKFPSSCRFDHGKLDHALRVPELDFPHYVNLSIYRPIVRFLKRDIDSVNLVVAEEINRELAVSRSVISNPRFAKLARTPKYAQGGIVEPAAQLNPHLGSSWPANTCKTNDLNLRSE